MAWIESNQELGRHPKTKKLARRLSTKLPETVGHLHYLWWWALDFADDGDLSRFESADIADAAMWEGDTDEFVEALIYAGFIEKTPEGGLLIHDWDDYAGKLIDRRKADARRKSEKRAADREASGGSPADIPETAGGVQRNRTVPNHTVPNRTEQDTTPQDSTEDEGSRPATVPYEKVKALFNSICMSYPQIKELSEGRKRSIAGHWKKGRDLDAFEDVFRRAEASPFLKGENDRKWRATFDWIIKPANWTKIAEGNYDDDGRDGGRPAGKHNTLGALGAIIAEEEGGFND